MKNLKRFRIIQSRSGADLGIYSGRTEAEALDTMSRDAGYRDNLHAHEVACGGEKPCGCDTIIVDEVAR